MKRNYISNLHEGSRIEDVFLITSKSLGSTRTGLPFIKMRLTDRTGTIDAVKWNATQTELGAASEMDYINARGTIGEYNGALQLTIDSFHKYTEKVDPSDFLATTSRDIDEMFTEFRGILAEVKNPQLIKLLSLFFDDDRISRQFREAPAATKVHHACIGGLLEHSLNVLKSSAALASLYPDADRDIVLTAAALHDIGKIDEYDWSVSIRFSDAGHFIGHLVGGAMMVKDAAARIEGFDPLLNLAMQHAILSHHGKKEYGSPKQPKSLEAMIVHAADELDAEVAMYRNAVAEASRDGDGSLFTKRHFFLDRPLFKGMPHTEESEESPDAFDLELFAVKADDDPFAEE